LGRILGLAWLAKKLRQTLFCKRSLTGPENRWPDFLSKHNKLTYYFCADLETNQDPRLKILDVAIIVPAHNEEPVIADTLRSLKRIVPACNIYVGSDASTDRTVAIARSFGVHALDLRPNRGKAGVITYLIKEYGLTEKYRAVMIVDADSEIHTAYLLRALPLFDDPQVAAIAGHACNRWDHRLPLRWSMFFAAYRCRLYLVLQAGLRYGQTWKYTNVTNIIPGFASIYRSSALKQIQIDAPGLVIEDFNMTFEVHHKKLGKILYDPSIYGISQDPGTLKDYIKQVNRWNLGFWQTVKRHGFWPGLFWTATGPFILEMLVISCLVVFLPLIVLWLHLSGQQPEADVPLASFTITGILLAVFLLDYILTLVVTFYNKKPLLLVYGLGFTLLRYIDSISYIYTLFKSFVAKSDGRWTSPARQTLKMTNDQ